MQALGFVSFCYKSSSRIIEIHSIAIKYFKKWPDLIIIFLTIFRIIDFSKSS